MFSERVENAVGKAEIAPFPTVFSKDLYNRHVKTSVCMGKGSGHREETIFENIGKQKKNMRITSFF